MKRKKQLQMNILCFLER